LRPVATRAAGPGRFVDAAYSEIYSPLDAVLASVPDCPPPTLLLGSTVVEGFLVAQVRLSDVQ